MNTRILQIACLLAAGSMYAPIPFAQQPPPPSASPAQAGSTPSQRAWPTPEQTVARLGSRLNLTEDQKAQITPIIANRQEKLREFMANPSGRRLQRARKLKSIFSESNKKIEAVLTSDQKKTYQEIKEEMREQIRERMQERNGGGPQQ